ncbi:MAG TPA: sigma 54-interacting transcriptional regulator [Pyrinomonadaceae bacterium]
MLHGIASGSGWWEELDCRQLADDERGDRTSLLLGGASGGVALSPHTRGLIEAAGTGTLFLTHVEKLPAEARRRMASVFASRYYTPAGDPFPRPVNCRVVVATAKPLRLLAQSYMIEWEVADALGFVALRAESVVKALGARNILDSHPGELAAAS